MMMGSTRSSVACALRLVVHPGVFGKRFRPFEDPGYVVWVRIRWVGGSKMIEDLYIYGLAFLQLQTHQVARPKKIFFKRTDQPVHKMCESSLDDFLMSRVQRTD